VRGAPPGSWSLIPLPGGDRRMKPGGMGTVARMAKKPSKANLKAAVEVLDHYVDEAPNTGQSWPYEQVRSQLAADAGLASDDDDDD
jgi:hypothetical protein